jgi:hypothetical protein
MPREKIILAPSQHADMVIRDRLLRWWTYFRRGHNTYLVFLLSFANFLTIQYRLLVEYVPALKMLFINFTSFLIAFLAIYFPVAVLIGWYDFKRFSVPVEASIGALTSPWNRDVALALKLIAEGRNSEAVEVLEKWVRGL